MASDAMQAAAAANRDVPASSPGPLQDCSDVVHIAVFFDGTGNNRDQDTSTKKWSNVARMFDAARLDPPKAIYRIYISGVGTPFNGTAAGWLAKGDVWLEDKIQGMGFGGGGDRRMELGADNVNQRLRDVLIANAQQQGGALKKYADASRGKSFDEVNNALGRHRLIKMINLSVFGFSRGAALARAFSNRVLAQCKREGVQLTYQGYPIRLNFLGLFDTVASFGVPAQNARLPWDERDLIVSTDVERCVHYVAAHEVRFSFPVDLIRKGGKLDAGWEEKVYPGVHSDVGGGYEPVDQGIENNYARIPMRDMMREAAVAGVRMLNYEQVRSVNFPLFQGRFEYSDQTAAAHRAYMSAFGAPTGTVEQQFKRHLSLLYAAYGTMHRVGMQTAGERRREEDPYKYIGPKGMAWEVTKCRAAAKAARRVRFSNAANTYAQYVRLQDWQLTAWDSTAAKGVVDFVSKFVHDSKVDFVGNVEPFSYFRMRGIQESTRSVWQETGDWIGEKSQQASDATRATYDEAARKANEAYDATERKARETYDAAQRKAREAYDATERKARQTYNAAEQKAGEAFDAGRRIVEQGTQWVEEKVGAAADAAGDAAKRAKKAVGL
jgi:hypothetical protein